MSQPRDSQQTNVSKKAVRGTFWSFMSFFAGRILTFVTSLVLAWLLTPEQFGIVGICMLAIAYLELLNNFGVGHALIARRDRFEEAANASFVIGLGSGAVLFVAAWVLAPTVAAFFREPVVADMFRVLGLNLLLGGVGTVPAAIIHRDLRFKAYLIPSIGRNILKGAVAIGMAWAGYGPWSLIWSEVVSRAVEALVPWLLVRWHPTFKFDWLVTREMLGFSGHMLLVTLLGSFMTNVDYLLIGRILGTTALGYYTLAYRIPELIIRSTSDVIARVAFPLLSQLQFDPAQLRQTYFGYLRYISLFTFPAGVGLFVLAPAFIRSFYKPEWEPAILPMQLISIEIGLSAVSYVPGIIYKAINRPEILTRLSAIKVPFVVGVLWYCTRWGIGGVAAGMAVLSASSMLLDSVVIKRTIGFDFGELWRALAPSLLGSAAMGLTIAPLAALLPPSGVASVTVPVLAGTVVYAGTIALCSRETVTQASSVLRATIARS